MTTTKKKTSFISKALAYVESTFMPIIQKLGENRYIDAIRNGMISIIPILLIGSTFLIIFFFPIGRSDTFGGAILSKVDNGKWASFVMLPYRLTYPMLGFFAVIGISRSLAKSYKLDDQQAVFMALIAYLISIVGPSYKGIANPSFTTGSFGSTTVFGGIIVAIFAVEIYRICLQYKIMIRLPKSVPAVVSKPFNALIPMLLVILPSVILFYLLKFDIHKYTSFIFSPLQSIFGGNNYLGFILPVILIMVLWIAGIHGMSIVGALARPFWLIAVNDNAELLNTLGKTRIFAPEGGNIIVEPFFQWFVWIGGAGATLGLIIAMLIFAKSKYIRAVTYPSILPGIFNINEPIIFGYPLVLNPFLALPAILCPIALGTISFICMKLGIVPIPVQTVGWTLPTPVGALLSTGLSWQACVLTFVLMAVATLIWMPFAIAYDKKMVKDEIENEIEEKVAALKKEKKEYDLELIRKEVNSEFAKIGLFGIKKKK